jgi:phenylpropionate dioxygenase-like ring-hydroxylating dioxygenase large terminal subunit
MLRDGGITVTKDLIDAAAAGYALPSSWYTDAAIYEQERDRILRRSWQFVAHTGKLREVGDQFICEIGEVPILLVRDEQSEIRGFVNICRHRAHPVVHEPGNRRTLQCLYHGWTYDLDGCLRRAPRAEAELDFDESQFGLQPVQVALWGPTIWVNVDVAAPPFAEWVNGLPDLVASHGIDVSSHVHALEREWTIRANWKVFLDNANECYHCPTCHPSLSKVLVMDAESREIDVAGPYRLSAEAPIRKDVWESYYGIESSPFADGEEPRYHFHWIFPTTYFQYKGRSDFEIGTMDVRGIDEIRFKHMIFMPAGASAEAIARRRESLETNPTIDEDVEICERVQQSHRARFSPPGRLLPRSEEAVQHFQRVLLAMLGDSGNGVVCIPHRDAEAVAGSRT